MDTNENNKEMLKIVIEEIDPTEKLNKLYQKNIPRHTPS